MTVAVSATGIVRFGRRPEGLVDLLAEAGARALEGVGRKPVDLLVVGHMLGGVLEGSENVTARVADRLGLDGAAGYRVEAASATGAAAFHAAVAEVASGHRARALVVAGEKMTGRPNPEVARALAHSLDPTEEAVGATMPALAALLAQRYAEVHARSAPAFEAVTVAARAAAARNPDAQFTTPVSAEEVSASPLVASPLRRLHCAAISDGAAAAIVERSDGPARVLGLGEATDHLRLVDRAELTGFRATRLAARQAYEAAHLTRKAVGVAEVHDAFAPFALLDLEDLGLCGGGEASEWFSRGWTGPHGRLPVNPSGGLLGRGHPVGASGLAGIVEIARQLRGEAGPTTLPKAPTVGLAQSIGGLGSHNFVTLLGREAAE